MKNFLFITLLFLVSCSGNSSNPINENAEILKELKSFPPYNDVATKFFEGYAQKPDARISIKFAKKKEGWVVLISDYSENEIKPPIEYLFWSKMEKNYVEVKSDFFTKPAAYPEKEIKQFLKTNYNSSFYAGLMPLYGYFGYENDLIDLLEGYDKMDDTLCHALGVAYFSKAFSMLGYEKIEGAYYKDEFDSKQIETYLKLGEKCRDIYLKGIEINPNFEGFVGNLRTKMGHDLVGIWYEMYLRGFGDKAAYLLKDIIYPENIIDFAKHTLSSCEQNAILFTSGDTDTYSLLYVQHHLNFRKDVAVINTSLLQTSVYPLKWRVVYNLPFSLSDKSIQSNFTEIFTAFIDKSGSDNVQDFLYQFSEENLGTNINEKVKSIDSYINSSQTLTWKREPVHANELSEMPFTWGRSYEYRATLLMLNLIVTNNFNRPIYFTSVGNYSEFKFLKPYMSLEGMVIQILPKKLELNGSQIYIDKEKLLGTLNNDLFNKKYSQSNQEYKITYTYTSLLLNVIFNDEIFDEEIVLKMMEKYFTRVLKNDKTDLYSIYVALQYDKMNNHELAISRIDQIFDKIEKDGIDRMHNNEESVYNYCETLTIKGYEKESQRLKELFKRSKK